MHHTKTCTSLAFGTSIFLRYWFFTQLRILHNIFIDFCRYCFGIFVCSNSQFDDSHYNSCFLEFWCYFAPNISSGKILSSVFSQFSVIQPMKLSVMAMVSHFSVKLVEFPIYGVWIEILFQTSKFGAWLHWGAHTSYAFCPDCLRMSCGFYTLWSYIQLCKNEHNSIYENELKNPHQFLSLPLPK